MCKFTCILAPFILQKVQIQNGILSLRYRKVWLCTAAKKSHIKKIMSDLTAKKKYTKFNYVLSNLYPILRDYMHLGFADVKIEKMEEDYNAVKKQSERTTIPFKYA